MMPSIGKMEFQRYGHLQAVFVEYMKAACKFVANGENGIEIEIYVFHHFMCPFSIEKGITVSELPVSLAIVRKNGRKVGRYRNEIQQHFLGVNFIVN